MVQNPRVLEGGYAKDKRGSVRFVNDFDFKGIKRFYHIENATTKIIRAFHGHMKEAKYVYVSKGKILFCAVRLTDKIHPSKRTKVHKFILSSDGPSMVHVPPGYANGFKSLTKDASVLFFSTASIKASKKDDYRFDEYYWGDVWNEKV